MTPCGNHPHDSGVQTAILSSSLQLTRWLELRVQLSSSSFSFILATPLIYQVRLRIDFLVNEALLDLIKWVGTRTLHDIYQLYLLFRGIFDKCLILLSSFGFLASTNPPPLIQTRILPDYLEPVLLFTSSKVTLGLTYGSFCYPSTGEQFISTLPNWLKRVRSCTLHGLHSPKVLIMLKPHTLASTLFRHRLYAEPIPPSHAD